MRSDVPEAAGDDVRVVFVCWGNICRSPMAERVAERMAADEGLTGVRFTSAATSGEELGEPMDPRAERVLERHGYRSDLHQAHRITAEEISEADLVVAMEDIHVTKMAGLAPESRNVVLLTDFDPEAEPGSGVPDPWYGSASGFEDTLAVIEAAMPGIVVRIRELQSSR
jgi:protein-tyrosine phosphatase